MITRAIENCLRNASVKAWEKTYWAIDIHGTLLQPTYQSGVISTVFYPYAKEVMQLLTKRNDIVLILYTCSYPHEIVEYIKHFEAHGIRFHYINENPEVCAGAYGHYENKIYFNVLFEDKAGFDPLIDWPEVYKLLVTNGF